MLFPFAKSLKNGSQDQETWNNELNDDYARLVNKANKTTFMVNYLGTPELNDPCIGGANVITSDGQIIGSYPIGQEGIYYIELDE